MEPTRDSAAVVLKNALNTQELEFEIKQTVSADHASERDLLLHTLKKINQKEARIKQAYRDGVDTLEEYKENKEILKKERDAVQEQLDHLAAAPLPQINYKKEMLSRIASVHDLLQDDTVSIQQKNEAFKSIVEKIVYYKASDSITVFFYYA